MPKSLIVRLNALRNGVGFCRRNAVEFPKFLGISIELLLRLCDDEEADVRIAADESLNRTIKVSEGERRGSNSVVQG